MWTSGSTYYHRIVQPKHTEAGLLPQGDMKGLGDVRAPGTFTSRRYLKWFSISRIKIWEKSHCNVWGDVLDKSVTYGLWHDYFVSMKQEKSDIEIKKIFNMKRDLKAGHHFKDSLHSRQLFSNMRII